MSYINVPYVVEQTPRGERQHDIFSRLLMDRIVFIGGEINDTLSNAIIAQLLFLESNDPKKDISIYINSPGGSVTAGLAIYDTMNYIKPDIATYCIGQAASMGAFLLSGGTKGKRFITSNARVMLHQPLGGIRGQAKDMEIHAKEIINIKNNINKILAENTGKTIDLIERDTDRDFFMTSDEALKYGIVDKVIKK
jgi:ATP-dependent Clp protease, protease subunit